MVKLLKIFGIGLLSGAAYRIGSMAADALFPKGLEEFLSKFNKQETEDTKQPKVRFLKLLKRD